MPHPEPTLDPRGFKELMDELLRRIPVYAPDWADHDVSDPGVTLLELLAFLGEDLMRHEGAPPGRHSETLAAVRERLQGRLDYLEAEEQRVRAALERLDAIDRRPGQSPP